MTTQVYVFVVRLELDDGPPKELFRTQWPVVDSDVAHALAAAALDRFTKDYPSDRLLVGFRRVT